jgi:uncharacterized protein with NRDE domain
MCTLSFIPKPDGGFHITHNRDEVIYRNSESLPTKLNINNLELISPIDPESGGTWITMANNGTIACLLNGGFEKHTRDLPYRHSRGIIIFDFFNYNGLHDFLVNYDLSNIEPFTLIIYNNDELFEIVWDGEQKHMRKLDKHEPHFYSSSTLYNAEMKLERKTWFRDWLSQKETPSLKEILEFHHCAGKENEEYGLLMKRSELLQTISISSIERKPKELSLVYENLLSHEITEHKLKIKRAVQLV